MIIGEMSGLMTSLSENAGGILANPIPDSR
jgi:hypothetical protein